MSRDGTRDAVASVMYVVELLRRGWVYGPLLAAILACVAVGPWGLSLIAIAIAVPLVAARSPRIRRSIDEAVVSIAGSTCESGDMLIWNASLPRAEAGDVLAVFSTGAYNYSMASNYNKLPHPAVVLVKDGRAALMVKRQSFEDLVRNDCIPEWLE